MSGLLDQAGLTAGSGLSNGAGLYKWGNFNPFDPTDLDPYLLFDTAAGSMIGTLENPTLDLDPSNQETLDVITATRASVATRTLPDGSIALAEQDTVRVDYTQGAELTPTVYQNIGYTDFSQGWTLQAGITLNSNTTETLSPEGENNAAKVVSTDNTKGFFFGGLSLTVAAIRTIFLKGEAGGETITFKDPSGHGTPIVHTLTTEWVRYEMSTTNDGNNYQGLFIDNISVGTIYIYGPQLEEGTTATTFVANTTGSPKFIASATYGPRVPMILVEPSATNLFTHSEGINNFSTLSRTNCTYSLDSNPFGGFNSSCKITSNTFTNGVIRAVLRFNSVSGESNYFTLRVKKKNGWFLKVLAGNGTSSSNVDVGLSGEGFISAGGTTANSYTVEEFNDYYLIGIETLQNATTIAGLLSLIFYPDNSFGPYDLNTVEDFFVTGIQSENNATVATSYIPTQNVPVTRAADDLVISGSDFDFYNPSEGTFYVESSTNSDATAYIFQASYNVGNPYDNRHVGYHDPSNKLNALSKTGGNTQYSKQAVAAHENNELTRLAYSYKQSDFRVSFNGEAEPTPVGTQTPSTDINQLHLGDTHSTGDYSLTGHLKRFIYWPTHSSRL